MDLKIGVPVYSQTGLCGKLSAVIMNPVTDKITHIVVTEKDFPHTERIIPQSLVKSTDEEAAYLSCDTQFVHTQQHFVETEYIPIEVSSENILGEYYFFPYVEPLNGSIPIRSENVPSGELSLHRGEFVEARDGSVGSVDELIYNSEDKTVTHLVLREGHLWGKKEIAVPVADIDHIESDTVYLNIDKKSIDALPEIPLKRRWP
jgi:uncharacterized protein YrrD